MSAAAGASRAGSTAEPAFRLPDEVADGARLWLVRHGETEWSRTGRHTGRTDVGLTPHGEDQAAALRPTFAGLQPALVLCSPRQRARRTAELAGLPISAIDDDLAEWDYGAYEGRTSAEIHVDDPGWTIFSGRVPGGETAQDVRVRADRVLVRAAGALAAGPVVLVAHGHICRVIGARWIGLGVAGGAHLLLAPAAPCILGVEYHVPVIDQWNPPQPEQAGPNAATSQPKEPERGR
jgi:probable phosphoglycerate mutase